MIQFRILIPVLAVLLFADTSAAADYYGPATVAVSGKKGVINESFDAPNGQTAWLEILNGSNGKRAKSVIVILNKNKIATKNEVNAKVRKAKLTILLNSTNQIKIVARGKDAEVQVLIKKRKANFKRLAGYGDSLLAGFQDGSLVETFQVWGFGAQIANQAGAKFTLPLISEPGIPPRLVEMSNGTIKPMPNVSPGHRTNPEEDADNLAVPGANVWTSLHTKTMELSNPLYSIILGGNQTMIEAIQSRKPTFVILWIGSNDILGMALNTDPIDHTNLADFKRDYETILKMLRSMKVSAVAANLPDVTALGLLVEPAPAALFNLPHGSVMPITRMLEILASFSFGSITPDDYLDLQEQAQIRATIREFNAEISKLCEKYGVPLVDAYQLSWRLKNYGAWVGGHHLTTDFREGIFGLDAIHPTNTGHALIANEFIEVMNRSYIADISKVDVLSVFLQDPHRPTSYPDTGQLIETGEPNPFKAMLKILRSAEKPSLKKRH